MSGWASQTGLTNDLTSLATAGGISDNLMRPQGFCAYREGEGQCGGKQKAEKKEFKMDRKERCTVKQDKGKGEKRVIDKENQKKEQGACS